MPVKFWFEKDLNAFWFEITGSEPRSTYFDAIKKMFLHEDFKPGMGGVWDLRETVQELPDGNMAMEGAREMVSMAEARGESRIAVIVKDEYGYGMVRMYLGYADSSHLEFRIFYDADEARAWIMESTSA